MTFTVVGIVEYWPTFNSITNNDSLEQEPMLIVGNLSYIQIHIRVLVNPQDIHSIFAALSVALLIVLGLLGLHLFNLKVYKALKLVED